MHGKSGLSRTVFSVHACNLFQSQDAYILADTFDSGNLKCLGPVKAGFQSGAMS